MPFLGMQVEGSGAPHFLPYQAGRIKYVALNLHVVSAAQTSDEGSNVAPKAGSRYLSRPRSHSHPKPTHLQIANLHSLQDAVRFRNVHREVADSNDIPATQAYRTYSMTEMASKDNGTAASMLRDTEHSGAKIWCAEVAN